MSNEEPKKKKSSLLVKYNPQAQTVDNPLPPTQGPIQLPSKRAKNEFLPPPPTFDRNIEIIRQISESKKAEKRKQAPPKTDPKKPVHPMDRIRMFRKDKSVVFFNMGTSCLMRLFVALRSLRKYYNGHVIVLMIIDDDPLVPVIEEDLRGLFQVQVTKLPKVILDNVGCNKNTGYTIKPTIFKIGLSATDKMICSDSDVLFRTSPEPLFDMLGDNEVLVTQYRNWRSDGRMMSKRIRGFSDIFPAEEIDKAINAGPAINTGIFGVSVNSFRFMNDWQKYTISAKCRFIVDEIICQCIYFNYKHKVLDETWNYSCLNDNFDDAKIIHFHGKKHARLHIPASKIWLTEFQQFVEAELLPQDHMTEYVRNDPKLSAILMHNDIDQLLSGSVSAPAEKEEEQE